MTALRPLTAWVALLRAAIVACLALTAATATAGTYTVTASQDSWINQSRTSQNNGTATTLSATHVSTTSETRAVIGFTLPTIPSNEVITNATLKLFVTTAGTSTVTVNRLTLTWTETTVTWSNMSGGFNGTAETSFTPTAGAQSLNVTSLVQAWYSGTANNGLGLIGALGTGSTAIFASKENATVANRPQLVITTALISPVFTISKTSSVVSDPQNGTVNPKAIPGAKIRYTISASNSTAGTADSGSTQFTDPIPAGMKLFVGDAGAVGSGPVIFTDGATSSGLTYSYVSLASTTDSISFSNDGGVTYTYTPVPDANGYDASVTNVRIALTGTFAGKTGASAPSLTLQMFMQVK